MHHNTAHIASLSHANYTSNSPNPFIHRSFLWSSQRIRTWLEELRRPKQYRNRTNLTPIYRSKNFVSVTYIRAISLPSADPTAIKEGIWSTLVSLPLCVNSLSTDSTVTTRLTDPILADEVCKRESAVPQRVRSQCTCICQHTSSTPEIW